MKSSTHSQIGPPTTLADVLRLKREYLLPCVYHFYRDPPLIVAARDCELIDDHGRRYLDFYSGVTVVNAGHCNPAITAATIAQLQRLDHTTTIYLTEPLLRLAERLATILPGHLKRTFFCTSGSEANEGALLLAALHTGRSEFVALSDSLHGRTKAAMSVTGLPLWRTDPAPVAGVHFAPHGDLAALERVIQHAGPARLAALIAEPIQGNGGIHIPAPGYWPAARQLCDRHGILLIFDEVQTGLNRTGRWWACEHWNVVPDILTTAKALANGYPISAFATTDAIAASYSKPGASTFGGNPVGAATALATLEFHTRQDLGTRARQQGEHLLDGLRRVTAAAPGFANVRGLGLMVAVDVIDDAAQPSPQRLDALLEALKDRGVMCGKTGAQRNVLTLMPPLTVTTPQIDEFLAVLRAAIQTVAHA